MPMDFSKIDEGYAEGEKPLHFYYNREERLKNAPKIVQDYYAGKVNVFTRNPIKILFANRLNRFMVIFLLLFCATAWFLNYQTLKNKAKICGTYAELSAFSYSDEVYVSLKFEKKSEKNAAAFSPVPVSVIFSAIDSSGTVVFTENSSDLYAQDELFIRTRFSDYDIIRVNALVSSGEEQKDFSADVIRR